MTISTELLRYRNRMKSPKRESILILVVWESEVVSVGRGF